MKCPKCNTDNPSDSKYCKECSSPLPSLEEVSISHTKTLERPKEELTTGSTFAGRYQIIEELGKGGMGKVYRVLDKKLNEEVALKLIKPKIASDKKTLERFSNELKIARKIVHKSVGRMFDLNEEEETHYITMEYVPGQDLKGLIRQSRQLTVGTAITIAKQVCEGLEEAHRLGVIHRDLKPSNIMIDKEGNARIMDFGIARSLKAKGITGTGVMVGTPKYMPPEQVEGKESDQRSDIYSLGVILYEMVTGQVLFEGDTAFSIALKQKNEKPKDPKELNTQVPEDLSNIILKCLEKDKVMRYQSAKELLADLRNIEEGIPLGVRIPSRPSSFALAFRRRKFFIPALVVFLAIIVVGIWQLLPQKETVPIPSDKPTIAIPYFENNTGDESLEYLRSALSEWLIFDLSESKFINVLSGDRIHDILEKLSLLKVKKYSSEDLIKIANQGGANYVLKGTYSKLGENLVMTVMLQKPHTGKAVRSREARCKGEEEIPPKIDELTKQIKLDLNLSSEQIASDIDWEVGKITTNSPRAFNYYSEGRNNINKGNERESINFIKRAIAIDPEFAMAYRSLAISYLNIGYKSKWKEYIQKAFNLTDRLTDRERYLVQGSYYESSEKTYYKGIEAFRKLLELHPDDLIANNNLGYIYALLEQWDNAIEMFEVFVQKKIEKSIHPYENLAHVYMAKGLYNKAIKVLESYLNTFTDNSRIHCDLAINYLCKGEYNLAFAAVEKALSLNRTLFRNIKIKGDIYLCKGDFIKAEEEYQKLLLKEEQIDRLKGRNRLAAYYLTQGRFEKLREQLEQGIVLAEKLGEKEWNSRFHKDLAYSYLRSGNHKGALKECDVTLRNAVESESYFWQRRALHLKGLTYLAISSMDEAQRVAEKLKESIEKGLNKKAMRYYFHLIGMRELERENFTKAIEYFKKTLSLLPFQFGLWEIAYNDNALFIDSLALAYYKSGELDKAQEEYERITRLTIGRLWYGDIYAKSFYMLAKLYEQKGWKGKAIENYQKFLALWKDADPGRAETADAKKQLVVLSNKMFQE